jgi:VanZ family protein
VLPVPSAGGDVTVAGPFGVGADKWVHAASYALLAALAVSGRVTRFTTSGAVGLVVVVLAVAGFGAGIEVAQSFVPGRTASGGDVVANTIGAVVGVACVVSWWVVARWRRAGQAA